MWRCKVDFLWSDLLCRYLKLGNYLLIIPFAVTCDNTGVYHCSLRRKTLLFLTGLLHGLSITYSIRLLYVNQTCNGYDTLESVSKVLVVYPIVAYDCALLLQGWTRRRQTERLLNQMKDTTHTIIAMGMKTPSPLKVHHLSAFVCSLTLISTVMEVLLKEHKIHVRSSDEIIYTLTTYKEELYAPYFSQDTSAGRSAMSVLTVLVEFYTILLTHFADQLCLALVISLFFITRAFILALEENSRNLEEIIHLFNKLAMLSDTIEESHGILVFFCSFSLLPYYSLRMKEVYNGIPGSRVQFGCYLLTFILVMWISADTNAMMQGFFAWLRNSICNGGRNPPTLKQVNDQALLMTVQQVCKGDFGIKGRAFTITYGFIGNMIALILTYAVIAFQFH